MPSPFGPKIFHNERVGPPPRLPGTAGRRPANGSGKRHKRLAGIPARPGTPASRSSAASRSPATTRTSPAGWPPRSRRSSGTGPGTPASRAPARTSATSPRAAGIPYTYWAIGGTDPQAYRDAEKAGRVQDDIPGNHSPRFLPVLQPTLRTGTEAMVTAALAWLAPRSGS